VNLFLDMIKNSKNVQIDNYGRTYFCPVEVTMSIVGGKWTAPVLWYLRRKDIELWRNKKDAGDHV